MKGQGRENFSPLISCNCNTDIEPFPGDCLVAGREELCDLGQVTWPLYASVSNHIMRVLFTPSQITHTHKSSA